ncbi:hypothetical protein EJK55_1465 [Moraxella catarrhalis]|nr:hypothetical protein EJK55_1465 [Moraxella catarrhalis]
MAVQVYNFSIKIAKKDKFSKLYWVDYQSYLMMIIYKM